VRFIYFNWGKNEEIVSYFIFQCSAASLQSGITFWLVHKTRFHTIEMK